METMTGTLMSAIMTVGVLFLLVGCNSLSQTQTIHIKHYNADHGKTIKVYTVSGNLIAEKVVEKCGMVVTDRREHSTKTAFEIDADIDEVLITNSKYNQQKFHVSSLK